MLKQLIRLGGRNWWLSFLLWIAMICPAQAAIELRVAIEDGVKQVKVGSSTPAVVRDGTGRVLGEIAEMNGLDAQTRAGGVVLGEWQADQIWIEPTNGGYVWIGDRWYRGRTRVVPTSKGITAVNYVDLEQYLYSVLGAEMSASWPLEALKAQAVAARSYALNKRQTSTKSIYDVVNTQTSQVYKGLTTEAESTQTAVNATAGQVMTYNGKIILAVFHSSSGGHTENVENVWSSPLPYLRGVPDYDQGTPQYQWEKTISASELSRRLGISNVKALLPERTSTYGRIMSIKAVGAAGSRSIAGTKLREALGLKSTRFSVTSTPIGFQFNGYGFGHGLGLSQWGAYNLAQQGMNYQQILQHYYQNISLSQLQG
ncbi:MAG TPA: SpoIID/LytB domain-containing protein [Oculatellaceae cyanobacterium]|jgi:stage II sporulation protein D